MKRRNFLKGVAAAIALGLSPVLLNVARLRLAEPMRRVYRFWPGDAVGNISEVGIGYNRVVLDQTITVLADEYLDITYEHRLGDQKPKVYVKVGKEIIVGHVI